MRFMKDKSISRKLVMIFMYMSIITLVTHFVTYMNINHVINRLDSVYTSNSNLSQFSQGVGEVQKNMYTYLNLKSSDALENYYISIQNLQNQLVLLNDELTDTENLMMESHIRRMTEAYIEKTGEAVQAKRGRNIRQYNERYNEASEMAGYMETYIESLNNIQFKENSTNYRLLRQSLNSMELVSTVILMAIIGMNVIILIIISRQVTRPLINLSKTADKIAAGDFEIELPEIQTGDEAEVLSGAFNKMVLSIRESIEKLRERMAIESQMKENELKMENYLKDAKLKYLQSQINPHFLFNTLNAGMQLAMIEGAEQTSVFIENMAEFFRYSITRAEHEVTLGEELGLVDHYIYILNVRFSGEVIYRKQIDESLVRVKVPSMIIQPIVENIFQYGIRDIEWQGVINLRVYQQEDSIRIEVKDNGKGMSREKINAVLSGQSKADETSRISNGIGLGNVMSRLKLFYDMEDVMAIESEGMDKGTKVILKIPFDRESVGGGKNV